MPEASNSTRRRVIPRSPAPTCLGVDEAGYQPVQLIGFRGRIGRVRLFAYTGTALLICACIAYGFGVWVIEQMSAKESFMLGVFGLIIGGFLGEFVFAGIAGVTAASTSVRRLHDLGKPGQWALLLLVPLLNVLFLGYLLLVPGAPEENAYGEVPEPNTWSVWLIACICAGFAAYVLHLVGLDFIKAIILAYFGHYPE